MIGKALRWIVKLVLGLLCLAIHWSLFLLFIILLMLYSWWKQRRFEQTRLSEEQDEGLYREFELFDLEGKNEDGTDRQAIYEKCYRGDEVTLRYNPSPGEENRLEVWTKFGQIGLIAPHYVEQYADYFKSGVEIRGRIKRISSGPNAFCLLEIAFPEEGSGSED